MKVKAKKYYIDLDILRLVSCILVLFYHFRILKGGFLAVCSFLVLSAYLETISLFNKKKISLKEYYINRFKKLYLPLLIVVFISISLVSIFNINWFNLKSEVTSVLFGYNNFWQLHANLDYFTRHVDSPFIHLWYISLLVQFDIILPLLFKGFKKIGEKTKKYIPIIITNVLAIVSIIYFIVTFAMGNVMNSYYNTFARLYSLLFGFSLAFIHNYYKAKIKKTLNTKNKKLIYYLYIAIIIILSIFVDASGILFIPSMILTSLITCRLIDYSVIRSKQATSKSEKRVKGFASITYEIYLVQYPIVFFFQYLNINNFLKIPLMFILIIISSYIINYLFKKDTKGWLKRVILIIISLLSLFGIYKYIVSQNHAKEMKRLEQELAENEKNFAEKKEEYLNRMQNEQESWDEKLAELASGEANLENTVTNLSVVGIGDSVLLGAVNNLYKTFPKGYFDGKVSRTAWALKDILIDLKNRKLLGEPIVLNLGANGDCSNECKEEIMDVCGNKDVFWVNVTNDKDVHFNAKLNDFAKKYSNLHVIDWETISKGHSNYFVSDGIHLTPDGRVAYSKAIYDAIYKVYLDKYNKEKNDLINSHTQEKLNRYTFIGNDLLMNSFDTLQENFSNDVFLVNKDFTIDSILSEIDKKITEKSLTKRVVLAFNETTYLTKEDYKKIFDKLTGQEKIYVVTTTNKTYNFLKDVDNIKIINLSEKTESNSKLLSVDKIHLTEEGRNEFSELLKSNLLD